MSWPSLNENYRTIDWSIFNWEYNPWPIKKPKDVQKFLANHPKIDVAVLRFAWPDGSPDSYYPTYFDEFTAAGVRVMGYGWPNKYKTVGAVMENWKRALGDRIPLALWSDWEETDVLSGLNQIQMKDLMLRHYEGVAAAWPAQRQGFYSRGGWLDGAVGIMPAWMKEVIWWLAHWIYPPPDFTDQATTFGELDAMLPIDNNFTPFRGNIIKIAVDKVAGWQGTSTLDGHGDAGYFLKSIIDSIFGGGEPIPPEPEKIPILIEVPEGKTEITIREI